MLQEQDRQKLDGIVQQMVQNQESDTNIQAVVNDFKSKYDKGDATSLLSSPPPAPPQKNIIDRAGDFAAKDILGIGPVDKNLGFFGGLLQSTIGSKGLAGVAQLPGRTLVAKMTAGAIEPLAKSQGDLAHVTMLLAQKVREMDDSDPRKQQLIQTIQENGKALGIGQDELNNLAGVQTTTSEALGTTFNAGATALGGLNPTTFAQKMLLSTGLGAAYGAGGALGENKSAGQVGKSALIGGVLGAGTQAVASGIGALVKYATEKLPTRLLRDLVGQSKSELLAGKDVSKYILENKKVGTFDGLINDGDEAVSSLGQQIQQKLNSARSAGGVVSNDQVAQIVAQSINDAGGQISKDEVLNAVRQLAPQAKGLLANGSNDVQTANQLRQLLDQTLGDKGFLQSQLPFNKYVLREFANTLRTGVKAVAPPETRGLFDQITNEINLRDALLEQETKLSKGAIVKFRDLLGAGLGSSIGAALGGGLGGIPGAAIGVGVERGMQSAPFLTGTSVGLNELQKLAPYMQKLSPAARLFIMSSIGGVGRQ